MSLLVTKSDDKFLNIALVKAENMYYWVANSIASPVLWEAYSEQLNEYKIGKGENSINSEMSPLCTYTLLNETIGLVDNKDLCAVRQQGSYINKRGLPVVNEFGLRIFYCKNINTGTSSILICS